MAILNKTDYWQELTSLISQLSEARQKELISYIRNFVNSYAKQEDNLSLADVLAFPKPKIEIEDIDFERVNIQLRDCDLGE